MASPQVLKAAVRSHRGKANRSLRRDEYVPGVVYGHGTDNQVVSLVYNEFKKVYEQAGSSSIVSLDVDGNTYDVLIHEVELDPVSDRYFHVDFLRIKKGEKIEAEIPIHFTGESSAVKDLGGVLVKGVTALTVRCLPQDLVHQFDVDISGLQEFNQPIHVKDMHIPAGLEVLTDMEAMVVNVSPPRKEEESTATEGQLIPEELKAQQEAAATAAQQDEKKDKKE